MRMSFRLFLDKKNISFQLVILFIFIFLQLENFLNEKKREKERERNEEKRRINVISILFFSIEEKRKETNGKFR